VSKFRFSSGAAVGYRAEGPGYLVWYETPEEVRSWATALAGARRMGLAHRQSEGESTTMPHDPSRTGRPLWRRGLPLAVLCGFALMGAEGVEAQDPAGVDWDHQDLQHRYVRITDAGPRPDSQTLDPKHAVGWLNYSSLVARVRLPVNVAAHMTCTSDGGFRLVGERLVSPDIQASQFVSLCRLAPGAYPYEITLVPGLGRSPLVEARR